MCNVYVIFITIIYCRQLLEHDICLAVLFMCHFYCVHYCNSDWNKWRWRRRSSNVKYTVSVSVNKSSSNIKYLSPVNKSSSNIKYLSPVNKSSSNIKYLSQLTSQPSVQEWLTSRPVTVRAARAGSPAFMYRLIAAMSSPSCSLSSPALPSWWVSISHW